MARVVSLQPDIEIEKGQSRIERRLMNVGCTKLMRRCYLGIPLIVTSGRDTHLDFLEPGPCVKPASWAVACVVGLGGTRTSKAMLFKVPSAAVYIN